MPPLLLFYIYLYKMPAKRQYCFCLSVSSKSSIVQPFSDLHRSDASSSTAEIAVCESLMLLAPYFHRYLPFIFSRQNRSWRSRIGIRYEIRNSNFQQFEEDRRSLERDVLACSDSLSGPRSLCSTMPLSSHEPWTTTLTQ